ncbi:MAG: hypothetical protein WAZ77_07945 [Candidatus Nitrosopolaris sp.]
MSKLKQSWFCPQKSFGIVGALVLAYAPDPMMISTSAVFTVVYTTGCGNPSCVDYTEVD